MSAPGYYGNTFSTTVMSSTTHDPADRAGQDAHRRGERRSDQTARNPVSGALVSVAGLSNVHHDPDAQRHVHPAIMYRTAHSPVAAEVRLHHWPAQRSTVTYPNPLTQNLTLGAHHRAARRRLRVGQPQQLDGDRRQHHHRHLEQLDCAGDERHSCGPGGHTGQPMYTGAADTYMTTRQLRHIGRRDQVWLSFNLYDSAESEYDISDAGIRRRRHDLGDSAGEASPVHGWQAICLDMTNWKSATMKVRFYFHSDAQLEQPDI